MGIHENCQTRKDELQIETLREPVTSPWRQDSHGKPAGADVFHHGECVQRHALEQTSGKHGITRSTEQRMLRASFIWLEGISEYVASLSCYGSGRVTERHIL